MQRAAACFLLTALAATAAAQTPADRIFQSGVEANFSIAGHVGYPTPLAGATIEAHVGSQVATTLSAADGSYRLAIEQRHLTADTLVDLVSFGRGARSTEVWAGALGPYARLQTLAGGTTLSDSQEVFARLGPYSTAVSAALRGYNNFQRITDPALFQRAARASAPNPYLVYGLALIANGTAVLPAGAANTFAVVLSPALSQTMYVDVAGFNPVPCTQPSDSPVCAITAGLVLDPAVVPVLPMTAGVSYMPFWPYTTSVNSTGDTAPAYRINGATGTLFYNSLQGLPATVSTDGQGRVTLARSDGQPLSSTTSFVLINGTQVQQIRDVVSLAVRPSLGPGGVTRHAFGYDQRLRYPNNPEIPTRNEPATLGTPTEVAASDAALPALLQGALPTLAGGNFLLPLAQDLGVPPDAFAMRLGYDKHQFGASNGTALRRAQAFTWSSSTPGLYALQYGSTQSTVRLLNEEEPGIWRALVRLQNGAQEAWLLGLLMPFDGSSWSAGTPPTNYLAEINSHTCATPYGALDGLMGFSSCLPPFGWMFNANNTLDRTDIAGWGTWSYASGADAGRLLMNRSTNAQRRGWERVRLAAGRGFVLENVSNGSPAPAVNFAPTARLVRVTAN